MQGYWICGKCGEDLVEAKTQVRYLGNTFSIEMFKCPKCGMAMVTEEMAVKKMAEAEQLLEDK